MEKNISSWNEKWLDILAISPFIDHINHFRKEFSKAYGNLLNDNCFNAIEIGFAENLIIRLDILSRQVLLVERDVYGKALNKSFESHKDFVEFLITNPEAVSSILCAYPALAEIIEKLVKNFLEAATEFSERLVEDFPQLNEKILEKTNLLNSISKIELTSGELHCGSRSVVIVYLNEYPAIIYKPRGTELEELLSNLLENHSKLDDRSIGWILPKYYSKETHGWVQWIEAQPARSKNDIEKFFFRTGYLIAFSEQLGISDLHFANIVAAVDSPIPIDLEAGLTPVLRGIDDTESSGAWNLLGTGLLPGATWKGMDLVGIDICGIGCLEEQYCSMPALQVSNKGFSNEQFNKLGTLIAPAKNLIYRDGKVVAPWLHLSEILSGYMECFKHRDELAKMAEGFECFREKIGRYILRSTAGYHALLLAGAHPALMQSKAHRRKYFESCFNSFDTDDSIKLAEIESSYYGDVPRFEICVGTTKIREPKYHFDWIENHNLNLQDGLTAAKKLAKIRSNTDVERGCEVIEGSLNALRLHYRNVSSFSRSNSDHFMTRDLIEFSITNFTNRLSDYIDWQNYQNARSPANWYGTTVSAAGGYEYGVIGLDFYSGSTGIIWTLDQLGKYDEVGRILPNLVQDFIEECKKADSRIGGKYIGLASAILPIVDLCESHAPIFISDVLKAFQLRLKNALSEEYPIQYFLGSDYLGGVAGAIGVISDIALRFPDTKIIDLADQLFEILLEKISSTGLIPLDAGVSAHPSMCLTGLSHGQIGISLSLANYIKLNTRHESDAFQLSERLLKWELSQYNHDEKNWPDHRVRMIRQAKSQFEFGWSHGAPGIFLALNELKESSSVARDFLNINSFSNSIFKWRSGQKSIRNDSLCHGRLGIAALSRGLLLMEGLSHEAADNEMKAVYGFLDISGMLERAGSAGYDARFEPPGIMTGAAGIILGLRSTLIESPGPQNFFTGGYRRK